MKTTKTLGSFAAAATLGLLSTMCSDGTTSTPTQSTGGNPTTTGGATNTGGTTGGTTGGSTGGATGGSTGGSVTGGSTTGGSATGGASGGVGGASGGVSGGGASGGGAGGGGAAGASGGGGEGGKAGGGAAGANGGGGVAGGGKGGSAGSGGAATGTFADVAKIFNSNCTKCHDGSKSDRINLKNDAGLYMRLTTPIAAPVAKCQDQLLVDKSTPANSLIPKIVQSNVSIANADSAKACMVNRMPAGGAMLSAANIATITSWVNAGAPEN